MQKYAYNHIHYAVFSNFEHAELKHYIELYHGKVSKTLTKYTTIVIVKDLSSGKQNAIVKKASSLGIDIIDLDTFIKSTRMIDCKKIKANLYFWYNSDALMKFKNKNIDPYLMYDKDEGFKPTLEDAERHFKKTLQHGDVIDYDQISPLSLSFFVYKHDSYSDLIQNDVECWDNYLLIPYSISESIADAVEYYSNVTKQSKNRLHIELTKNDVSIQNIKNLPNSFLNKCKSFSASNFETPNNFSLRVEYKNPNTKAVAKSFQYIKNNKIIDGKEIVNALTKKAESTQKPKYIKIQSGTIIDGSIHSVFSFPHSKIKNIIKNTH
jgi:hypothetical protein